jgi:hypothetical protein
MSLSNIQSDFMGRKKIRQCFNCGIEGVVYKELLVIDMSREKKDDFYCCNKYDCQKWIEREKFKRKRTMLEQIKTAFE